MQNKPEKNMFPNLQEVDFISYQQNSLHPTQIVVDITLKHQPEKITETIKDVSVTTNFKGDIEVQSLMNVLGEKRPCILKAMMYYYSRHSDLYIYCGKHPDTKDYVIPSNEIDRVNVKPSISLRIRKPLIDINPPQDSSLINGPSETEYSKFDFQEEETQISSINKNDSSRKRTRHKEREIGEVLDLVKRWRKLYHGQASFDQGKTQKMSLEEAAQVVGVAKKSLDDYLLMIKHAKNLDFNFHENKNERFGILRNFVKKNRSSIKKKEMSSFEIDFDFLKEDGTEEQMKDKKLLNTSKKIGKKN